MRTVSRWLLVVFLCVVARADVDLTKPIPVLTLKDGRTYRKVGFRDFLPDRVIVNTERGFIAVEYESLPHDVRVAAENKRPGGPRWQPGEIIDEKDAQVVRGVVFITTKGNGSYKFSEVTVYALPLEEALIAWKLDERPVRLPRAFAQTTTDADGRFILKLAKDTPFILFAQAKRLMADGREEKWEWRVPASEISDFAAVHFGSDMWLYPQTPAAVEPPL